MSKKILFILFIFLICFSSISIEAHPGKTDSSGGHYDYNNTSGLGDYHYHHGYSPHLHKNGVCPYNFDDQTGDTSSSYASNSSKSKPTYVNELWVYIAFIICIIVFLSSLYIHRMFSQKRETTSKSNPQKETDEHSQDLHFSQLSLAEENAMRKEYELQKKKNNSNIRICLPPPEIDENLFSKPALVLITKNSQHYHSFNCCGMYNAYFVTVDDAEILGKSPCKYCIGTFSSK